MLVYMSEQIKEQQHDVAFSLIDRAKRIDLLARCIYPVIVALFVIVYAIVVVSIGNEQESNDREYIESIQMADII